MECKVKYAPGRLRSSFLASQFYQKSSSGSSCENAAILLSFSSDRISASGLPSVSSFFGLFPSITILM
uniref:Uncharacterized protein n=1 Tax=Anguilla anguilla TaxID=7936 RepID=A0A0E9TMD2_ANGAN